MQPEYKISNEELESYIYKYCRDITALAKLDRFDPIHGRDEEIVKSTLILLQKGRKNVMLQAPAGVGKTALCVGLAQQIVAGNVPEYLKDARLIELDLASMAAGTASVSEFQGRFIPLVKGIAERYRDPDLPKFIMFIDEIHQIMPTCDGSSYKGLSEVMKPYLTVGDIHVIGATTKDEFRMYIQVDPAMDRRFQKVYLDIPDYNGTIMILDAIKKGYEKHHKIDVTMDMCEVIVKLTDEHMRKRYQPDKAITTMDGAMAKHVMDKGTGGELDLDSVLYIVAAETGLHPDALIDKKTMEIH
jgi:ATP-dependent Clp protease ATP-binding subunit ClpA